MKDPKGYYQTLKIPVSASSNEIKKAYKALAVKWHPDKNPGNAEEATEQFKKIAEAYDVLGNEEKRRAYDSNDFFEGNFSSSPNEGFHYNQEESVHHAFDMFNHFFANDPFFQTHGMEQSNGFFNNHLFNDPFFSNINIHSGTQFTSMGSGQSSCTRITTTFGSNGNRITRKETTIIHPDGRRETSVEENNGENMNIYHRIL
jgi:curved DNA-binding protein CbpA